MNPALNDPAVRSYLRELRRLLDGAPDEDLVLDGVRQHIVDALPPGSIDPERVRRVLQELGDPKTIAREAGAPAPGGVAGFLAGRGGAVLTVVLLTAGNLVLPLVSFLVGLALLWSSRGWTLTVKLVATLLPAAVLLALVAVGALLSPADGLSAHLALLVGLVVSLAGVAVLLLSRFQEPARQERPMDASV